MEKTLTLKAKNFAYEKHKGQTRKGKPHPFTNHLDAVYNIVNELTNGDDVLCAVAYLHDTVEDTDVTIEDIENIFGEEVAKLVDIESEEKEEDEVGSWKKRKTKQIKVFSNLRDKRVLNITLGDKLANLTELLKDYKNKGPKVWEVFNNNDPKEHYWYYNEMRKIFANYDLLKDTRAYKEYDEKIQILKEITNA